MVTFAEALRALRRTCAPALPVSVRRLPIRRDIYGDCTLDDGRFYIRIHRGMQTVMQVHTLIHEWAHAISWHEGKPYVRDHGPEWGIAYARCYTAVYGDDEDDDHE